MLVLLFYFISTYSKPIHVWKLKENNFERAREQYPIVILFRATEPEDPEEDEMLNTQFNASLNGLEEYGVNAAVLQCKHAPKVCKNLGIREESVIKYYSFVFTFSF